MDKDPDGKEVVNVKANLIAHAAVGAITSWASGKAALAGAVIGEYTAQQLYTGVEREKLSEEQRQTISALGTLAGGLAGGLTGGNTGSAITGAQTGKNAVENNYLSSQQIDAWSREVKAAREAGVDPSTIIEKYENLSTTQQKHLIGDCASDPSSCQQKYGDDLATA